LSAVTNKEAVSGPLKRCPGRLLRLFFRLPLWLGSVLVMIALIAVTNALVLWFVLAVGLGAITYAYRRPEIHHVS